MCYFIFKNLTCKAIFKFSVYFDLQLKFDSEIMVKMKQLPYKNAIVIKFEVGLERQNLAQL
jgi:hypothetical protein